MNDTIDLYGTIDIANTENRTIYSNTSFTTFTSLTDVDTLSATDNQVLTTDANGNLKTDESGTAIAIGSTGSDEDYWESVNGCAPTADQGCVYESADALKTGNASANSSYQTSTNIDINSNAFTNVFGQAF